MPSKSRSYGRRRRGNRMSMKGTKTEVTRKRVPRISTLNKKIKRIEDTRELKYNDVFRSSQEVDSAGVLFLMNGLAVGDTQITRTGAEVQATSLQIRGSFITETSVNDPTTFRMIVFWDRQANGADPLLISTGVGTPALLFSPSGGRGVDLPFMYETQDRFRVLYDKRYVVNPLVIQTVAAGETTAVIPVELNFKKKIKLNRRVKYDDINPQIDDINTNSLYIAFISTNQFVNNATVTFTSRFYFKDA